MAQKGKSNNHEVFSLFTVTKFVRTIFVIVWALSRDLNGGGAQILQKEYSP